MEGVNFAPNMGKNPSFISLMVFFATKTWVVYIIFIEKAINFDEFIPLRRGGEAAGSNHVSSHRSYRLIFQTISITLCHVLSI